MSLTDKQAKRNIKLYGLIGLFSGITFLVPIISIFYKYTGLSTAEIILVSNIFTFLMRFFELPTSVLADTFGRKKSLLASVISNFICALFILIFPNLIGFCIAAVFQALYYSFWSGTGQAFLEENLSKIGEREKFGRYFGKFSFYTDLSTLITPLISSFILKTAPENGYTILAALDCLSALILIIFTFKLCESSRIIHKFKSFKNTIKINIDIGKESIKNVFYNAKMRNFLVYRSLSHHVTFFGVLLLPILSDKGMIDWISGVIMTLFTIGSMLASKYAYKWGEKYGYKYSWVWSTISQAICLIIAGLYFKSWIFLSVIYFIFSVFDGIISPSRNHELIQLTKGKSIATTRSIIFGCVALYMTFMKRLLSYFNPNISLIILGIIILSVNIFFFRQYAKKSN